MNDTHYLKQAAERLLELVEHFTSGSTGLSSNITHVNSQAVNVGTGNAGTGTLRVQVASDQPQLSTINTAVTSLSDCVDTLNGHVEVDTNAINGVTMQVNSGNLEISPGVSGVQRICVATDDINLSKLSNAIDASSTPTNYIRGDLKKVNGTTITTNSGVKDAGCIRVCGASDDTAWNRLSALTRSEQVLAPSISMFKVYNVPGVQLTTPTPTFGIGIARQDGENSHIFIATGPGNHNATPGYTSADPDAWESIRVCIATDDVNLSSIAADITTIKNILTDVWDDGANALRTV